MTLNRTRGKLIDYTWEKDELKQTWVENTGQILRVNSNWWVVWSKETTGALKLENDKLLEQLKKQEKVTDVVIACCSQLWNSMHSQCENLGGLKRWKKWIEHYGKRRLTSSGWKEKGHTSAFLKLYNSCIFHLWDYILIMLPQYGISNFKKTWINLRRSKCLQYECAKSIDWLEMTAYFLVSTSPFWKTDAYISSLLLLNGQPVDFADSISYLGLTIFSWFFSLSKHIKSITSKARQLVGLLFRQFYKHARLSTNFILQLCGRIRRIWDPYLVIDCESIQEFASLQAGCA